MRGLLIDYEIISCIITEQYLYVAGIIIYYELWMRGVQQFDGSRDPPERRLFHPSGQYSPLPMPTDLDPPETNFTAMYLEPYTMYEFQVFCENSIGKAASVWVSGRTMEAGEIFFLDMSLVNAFLR